MNTATHIDTNISTSDMVLPEAMKILEIYKNRIHQVCESNNIELISDATSKLLEIAKYITSLQEK